VILIEFVCGFIRLCGNVVSELYMTECAYTYVRNTTAR
jgi:hypothetical protein